MNVFLSHSSEDRELARDIAKALTAAGLRVLNPDIEILPGDNWAQWIGQALEKSEAMVVLLTPQSLSSESIRRDIEYALGNPRFKERLVPVISDSLGSLSSADVPWILKRLKTVTLTQDDPSSLGQIAEVLHQAA